jgi:hypothetical protein
VLAATMQSAQRGACRWCYPRISHSNIRQHLRYESHPLPTLL